MGDWLADQLNEIKSDVDLIKSSVGSLFSDKKQAKDSNSAKSQEHLFSQLNDISSKMAVLEKSIAVGIPLVEASEGISKLENLQQSIDNLDSKLTLYISNSKELKVQVEELSKVLSDKVNKTQIESVSQKMDYLENLYSELSFSKTNESLISLIEIIENLRGRIKQLESSVEKEVVGHSFDVKNPGLDKDFDLKSSDFDRDIEGELAKEISGEGDSTVVEKKKKGFFGSLFGNIFSVFKKK